MKLICIFFEKSLNTIGIVENPIIFDDNIGQKTECIINKIIEFEFSPETINITGRIATLGSGLSILYNVAKNDFIIYDFIHNIATIIDITTLIE